jgi:hypothetical protein
MESNMTHVSKTKLRKGYLTNEWSFQLPRLSLFESIS